jgi:transcriptional regulator with XRE-family HTH domain
MTAVAALIREARLAAGLTQAELAHRAGLSQPAVARLERPGSNPTIATLDRVLRASGRRLELSGAPSAPLDEGQIRSRLALTPAEAPNAPRR